MAPILPSSLSIRVHVFDANIISSGASIASSDELWTWFSPPFSDRIVSGNIMTSNITVSAIPSTWVQKNTVQSFNLGGNLECSDYQDDGSWESRTTYSLGSRINAGSYYIFTPARRAIVLTPGSYVVGTRVTYKIEYGSGSFYYVVATNRLVSGTVPTYVPTSKGVSNPATGTTPSSGIVTSVTYGPAGTVGMYESGQKTATSGTLYIPFIKQITVTNTIYVNHGVWFSINGSRNYITITAFNVEVTRTA